ncbi:MAG: alpha-ketoglutarate-dependent dioxygenase AlkB [Acidimicrobiia bacterium]|nr:alpha-ketoglutarate-dependent dioxygenase AlkB [Acidimicrobiia bacterium]
MTTAWQPSLLEAASQPQLGNVADGMTRTGLASGAWVDYRPGWLSGADLLFEALSDGVPWHAETRRMYDRVVDVPRLTQFYGAGEPLPHPVLDDARSQLSRAYATDLGEPFVSVGLCLYRDGTDSVAWHGDRIGRGADGDTIVAIASVGSPRSLLLRPHQGGASLGFSLGHGDLLVMGGSCQRTWDHCVPKTARRVGPRISIQFRPQGVR